MNIFIALLRYLRSMTTGLRGQGEPRYQRVPESTPNSFAGYTVDDWFRALVHLLYFLKPAQGCRSLDGSEGPKNHDEEKDGPLFVYTDARKSVGVS
jgi:hypothetical protein